MKKLMEGLTPLIQENATVDVLNGGGAAGTASQEATTLQQHGFTVGAVASAPQTYTSPSKYTLYDLSKGTKPNTLTALKKELGVAGAQTTLPPGIASSAPFIVILGVNSSNVGSVPGQ